jgi:hypothetical protein
MYVRIALAAALIAACGSPEPSSPPHPGWTEEDTIAVVRREWDACLLERSEEECMARVKTLVTMFPATITPLTPCGALCNSNLFCQQGIIRQCQVCQFDGTCGTSIPRSPVE